MILLVSVCSDEAGRDQIGDTENEGAVSGGIPGSRWASCDVVPVVWTTRGLG